jgi:hypothetical protein
MTLLFAAQVVKKHLAWYLINDHVGRDAALKFDSQTSELIKNLGNNSLEICEGFGIPNHVVHAPIYTGYQEYYKVDQTGGEHYNVKMRPKF